MKNKNPTKFSLTIKNSNMTKHCNSLKSNNNFKKSSITQNNCNSKKTTDYSIKNSNKINNYAFFNLFSQFNNTSSLRKKNSYDSNKISKNKNNNADKPRKLKSKINYSSFSSSSSIKDTDHNNYSFSPVNLSHNNFKHIKIKFNLKNHFLNNSFSEKILEKNKKICELQDEIFKSQEILNNFNKSNKNLNNVLCNSDCFCCFGR